MAIRKAPKKKESRFTLINTIEDNTAALTDTVQRYRRRYVDEALDSGRDLARDIRKDPRKALGELADDGRHQVEAFVKESRASLKSRADAGRKLITRVRKDPQKAVMELVNDGKGRFQEVGKDARKRLDTLADDIDKDARLLIKELKSYGKKGVDRLTAGHAVREKIEKGLRTIPEMLNLPARDEMERLADAVEALQDNVDTMKRSVQCAQ